MLLCVPYFMIPTNLKEKLISYCDSDKQKIFWINRYIKYIEGCQTKNFFDTQIHKHHIVPKSWGGTDDSCNLIALPPRYHFDIIYYYQKQMISK